MKYSKKQIIACGKLNYSCFAEYEIINSAGAINISEILDHIYYSNNNKINIKVMNGCKTLYHEEGNLLRKRGENDIYDYHINGANLELVLFNNCDKFVDIEIVADTESLDMRGDTYGTETYEAKQVAK